MFTGIIEEAGRVAEVAAESDPIRLGVVVRAVGDETRVGDSLAVNGCCLTVVQIEETPFGKKLAFDLLRETWTRTNLQFLRPGMRVNLERPLPVNGRIHGHFVTGHVDAIGKIEVWEERGADWYLQVAPPPELLRYIIFKGSVAIDGISLTIASVSETNFAVWIIPHTRKVTALQERAGGDFVNLEADLLAKYAEKFSGLHKQAGPGAPAG